MFILYNNNPSGLETGDCVIRAITLALDYNWFMVHDELSFLSRQMTDMPSSNRVWKEYLGQKGSTISKVLSLEILRRLLRAYCLQAE